MFWSESHNSTWKYFNTLEHFKECCVHILSFKIIVFCVSSPLTDAPCLEELHFFDSVVTLHQTWCLLWFLCLSAVNWPIVSSHGNSHYMMGFSYNEYFLFRCSFKRHHCCLWEVLLLCVIVNSLSGYALLCLLLKVSWITSAHLKIKIFIVYFKHKWPLVCKIYKTKWPSSYSRNVQRFFFMILCKK